MNRVPNLAKIRDFSEDLGQKTANSEDDFLKIWNIKLIILKYIFMSTALP
jgi:hypothetical protein